MLTGRASPLPRRLGAVIMESLGGDRDWRTRFLAGHAAIIYYWVLILLWLFSPSIAYNFSELIEAHAVDTYGQFVDENEELLKQLPAPRVAKAYYNSPNLYLFDEFQARPPGIEVPLFRRRSAAARPVERTLSSLSLRRMSCAPPPARSRRRPGSPARAGRTPTRCTTSSATSATTRGSTSRRCPRARVRLDDPLLGPRAARTTRSLRPTAPPAALTALPSGARAADPKVLVTSPNTEAALVLATAAAAAASAVVENVGLSLGLSEAAIEAVTEGVEVAAEVLTGAMISSGRWVVASGTVSSFAVVVADARATSSLSRRRHGRARWPGRDSPVIVLARMALLYHRITSNFFSVTRLFSFLGRASRAPTSGMPLLIMQSWRAACDHSLYYAAAAGTTQE